MDTETACAPARVWTTETTHRDGQQGGLPLSIERRASHLRAHVQVTGGSGAIRQAEFFVYRRPTDAFSRRRWSVPGRRPIEPTTWIRASADDADLIREIGVRETGMLARLRLPHLLQVHARGRRRAPMYLDAVRAGARRGDPAAAPPGGCDPSPEAFVRWLRGGQGSGRAVPRRSRRPSSGSATRWASGLPYDTLLAAQRARSCGASARPGSRPKTSSSTRKRHAPRRGRCLAAIREGCAAINGRCSARASGQETRRSRRCCST